MEPKIGSKVNIDTKVRLETLYLYIYESCQSFGVDNDCLDSISKGIFEKKIIKKIHIKYLDGLDVVVGIITIEIDWEKYEIAAKTNYGATFTFDTNRSLREQLSQMTYIIDSHTMKIRQQFKVKKVDTSYTYIDEIRKNKEEDEKAMKFLGHVKVDAPDTRNITKEFKHSMEYINEKLDEVKISIRSN